MRYGVRELGLMKPKEKADFDMQELRHLNQGLEQHLKDGWHVKDFQIIGENRPVFVILLEK